MFSALAVAITALVHYVIPAKTVPMALVSLIGLVTFRTTGWKGGIVFLVVTSGLAFVFTGLSITFFTLIVLFVPYTVLAHSLRKLSYYNKTAFIRIPIVLVSCYITAVALMFIAVFVSGAQSVLYEIQGKIGIWLTALLFAIACVPADFFLSSLAVIISDKLDKAKKH